MKEERLREIEESITLYRPVEIFTHPKTVLAMTAEIRMLRTALEHIAGPCENYTQGTDCWKEGKIIDTIYSADRVCDACIARDALGVEG